MKYLDEYRDGEKVRLLVDKIKSIDTKAVNIMEVCGSQTHTILKYGLEEILPDNINIIHGPGCPVCVTPVEMIDYAMNIARKKDVVMTTYGDMMKVPGSAGNMLSLKAEGADIRIIYSPLDAVNMAGREPDKKVVLFAIGFETTAPANAAAIIHSRKLGLDNFFVLSSQVLIPPAVEYILSSDSIRLDALLAPGHVCTVTGYKWCEDVSTKYDLPVIVTGFEPVDILEGIHSAIERIYGKNPGVVNQYRRVVRREGNNEAFKNIKQVFKVCSRNWRGLGSIPLSGYSLKKEFEEYDALKKFNIELIPEIKDNGCMAGDILQGKRKPEECNLFGTDCHPGNPKGAPMVSSEGTCAAYFRYRRMVNE